jgi:hypothetical protein
MKRKLLLIMAAVLVSLASNAQFEEGKVYANASMSGLNMNYNGKGFNLGVQGQVGYLFSDDMMLLASASFNHQGSTDAPDYFTAGIGYRYYVTQNGLYFGVNGKLVHANSSYNDVMPGVEVGYCFFLSRTVSIEPAIYYDQSFKNHSDYSTIGLRIGFGFYL